MRILWARTERPTSAACRGCECRRSPSGEGGWRPPCRMSPARGHADGTLTRASWGASVLCTVCTQCTSAAPTMNGIPAMATLTARLPDWLKEEMVRFWKAHGEGPSSGLRRVVEEWWAMQEFPAIEFRDGVSGRRAAVRGGPDVWEVLAVAREYGDDREGLYEYFGRFVDREALDQALAYAARVPEEIEAFIAENERVEALLQGRDGG